MPTYREYLQLGKSEIDEVDATRARELLAGDDPPLLVDIREFDEWAEGRIPGAILIPRGNLESRIEQAAPDTARRSSSTARRATAPSSARKRWASSATPIVVSLRRRLHRLEAQRLRHRAARRARRREARPLQPAPPHPRGRRGGPAEAPRLARPAPRRGRARLTGGALSRGRRRRDARDRRRRQGRRLEPPAAGLALDRAPRRVEGGVGEADARRSSIPTSR